MKIENYDMKASMTLLTREDDTIQLESENMITIIKHNDIGISIDCYKKSSDDDQQQPFRKFQVHFDDVK